ncbi:MAG: hypothetical protein C0623_10335 [Desulfuromonas sp.]|nr:MAG: hypothetical protein C0623_10335 [Desulfuromonas sp.]
MQRKNRKQVHICGTSLAISGDPEQDWFIGNSPGHDALGAEGPWDEWVRLARAILAEEKSRSLLAKRDPKP